MKESTVYKTVPHSWWEPRRVFPLIYFSPDVTDHHLTWISLLVVLHLSPAPASGAKGRFREPPAERGDSGLTPTWCPKSCNSQGLRGPLPLCPTIAQILLTMVSCWQQYWWSVKMKGEGERNMKFIKTSFLFKSSQIKFLSRPSRHPMVHSSLWEE